MTFCGGIKIAQIPLQAPQGAGALGGRVNMVRKLMGAVAMAAAVQLIGISGANAAVHNVIADEIGGTPSEPLFTVLSDSAVNGGAPLCTANEQSTACFATSYTVPAGFINSAFRATGGAAAVNLIDGPNSDTPGVRSDELYLTVSPVVRGFATVT